MKEVIIVGSGPAGISAALYTARAGIKTTVIGKDGGALGRTDKVENYYGFEQPVGGSKLIDAGIAQAERVGASVIRGEVVSIALNNRFTVKTSTGELNADCVILATGASRAAPKLKGMEQFEGKGVSYCAVCDAFFYRGKDVAVLGSRDYALSEALELLPVVNSVSLLTNGAEPISGIPEEVRVFTGEIAELTGDKMLGGISFKDGSSIDIAGLFIAVGVAGSGDFARKLGAPVKNGNIIVNERMETGVPGLFAAGDCTGGLLQISKAVYNGAVAGTEAVKYIRGL